MDDRCISIREASAVDAALIGKIVTMALGDDLSLCFGNVPAVDVFGELAAREGTQYSFRNTLVAEVDGEAAGAIVGYDGACLHELRIPTLEKIGEATGTSTVIEDETSAGEYYLDSLAVLPEFRGCGVGRALLVAARDKAFGNGYRKVGLLVDFCNPRAEKLYASLGFRRVDETTFLGHRMWHLQATNPD